MEEKSETTEKLLEYALEWLKTAESFTLEHAPLIVKEFYMWETATSLFWMGFGAFLIITGVGLHIASNRYGRREDTRYGSLYEKTDGAYFFAAATPPTIGFIMFSSNLYNLIYISVAPRLYLIEEVSGWLS